MAMNPRIVKTEVRTMSANAPWMPEEWLHLFEPYEGGFVKEGCWALVGLDGEGVAIEILATDKGNPDNKFVICDWQWVTELLDAVIGLSIETEQERSSLKEACEKVPALTRYAFWSGHSEGLNEGVLGDRRADDLFEGSAAEECLDNWLSARPLLSPVAPDPCPTCNTPMQGDEGKTCLLCAMTPPGMVAHRRPFVSDVAPDKPSVGIMYAAPGDPCPWGGCETCGTDEEPLEPREVPPLPVRHPYYLTRCEHCGWEGSSESCGTISYGDDADVCCPACDRIMSAPDLSENGSEEGAPHPEEGDVWVEEGDGEPIKIVSVEHLMITHSVHGLVRSESLEDWMDSARSGLLRRVSTRSTGKGGQDNG